MSSLKTRRREKKADTRRRLRVLIEYQPDRDARIQARSAVEIALMDNGPCVANSDGVVAVMRVGRRENWRQGRGERKEADPLAPNPLQAAACGGWGHVPRLSFVPSEPSNQSQQGMTTLARRVRLASHWELAQQANDAPSPCIAPTWH